MKCMNLDNYSAALRLKIESIESLFRRLSIHCYFMICNYKIIDLYVILILILQIPHK